MHHRLCPLLSSQATSCPEVATPLRYLHLPQAARPQLPTPIMKKQTRSCPPCLSPSMVRNANLSHVCCLALSPLVRFSSGLSRAPLACLPPLQIPLQRLPPLISCFNLSTHTPSVLVPACRVTCSSHLTCVFLSKSFPAPSSIDFLSFKMQLRLDLLQGTSPLKISAPRRHQWSFSSLLNSMFCHSGISVGAPLRIQCPKNFWYGVQTGLVPTREGDTELWA